MSSSLNAVSSGVARRQPPEAAFLDLASQVVGRVAVNYLWAVTRARWPRFDPEPISRGVLAPVRPEVINRLQKVPTNVERWAELRFDN
jgi:hypothetical protein